MGKIQQQIFYVRRSRHQHKWLILYLPLPLLLDLAFGAMETGLALEALSLAAPSSLTVPPSEEASSETDGTAGTDTEPDMLDTAAGVMVAGVAMEQPMAPA